LRGALRRAPFEVVIRDEETRGKESVGAWIDEVSRKSRPRVALLGTRGELAGAYERAWGAVIGGTFAPYGGHNVWEPAARGCAVLVGPFRDGVAAAVESVVGAGGGSIAEGGVEGAVAVVERWLSDPDLEHVGHRALQAVERAAGAAERGVAALAEWGVPR
jgi:3-deoxy-D-manno-octulosonic-acid transferase